MVSKKILSIIAICITCLAFSSKTAQGYSLALGKDFKETDAFMCTTKNFIWLEPDGTQRSVSEHSFAVIIKSLGMDSGHVVVSKNFLYGMFPTKYQNTYAGDNPRKRQYDIYKTRGATIRFGEPENLTFGTLNNVTDEGTIFKMFRLTAGIIVVHANCTQM